MVRRFLRCSFCDDGRALGGRGRVWKCHICHGRGRLWVVWRVRRPARAVLHGKRAVIM